jgi:NAD-dependent deacetylase
VELPQEIQQVADWIRNSKSTVALTGAGISVDSGIPDFRSPGGLWTKFNPMEYATIQAFRNNPIKVWTMLVEMEGVIRNARPNPGHFGLAALERMGHLDAIITQNIDNLHQEAGNTRVVEFHGNGQRLVCLSCGAVCDARAFSARSTEDEAFPPRCAKCEAILKPDVVLFGEQIPFEAARKAQILASKCDVMLVVGTSAGVVPAAELPFLAKERGAKIVEINISRTHLSHQLADISLIESATVAMPRIVEALKTN